MPSNPLDFALSDVLTIVGILVTVGIQTFAAIRWITKRFEERDEAMRRMVTERDNALRGLAGKVDAVREFSREQASRVEREMQREMSGFRERLAVMPTRKDLDDTVRERLQPIEGEVRALVVELARLGLHGGDIRQLTGVRG